MENSKRTGSLALLCMLVIIAWMGLASIRTSQAAAAEDAVQAASQAAASSQQRSIDRGDNAWVLTSSALVLMMTGPGLALFYSGLVRKKNVLGVMMQCVFLMGLMTVIWALWGYSLAFGGSGPWLGNLDFVLMKGVQPTLVDGQPQIPIHPDLPLPRLTHMLFQGMFFIITPALICGAFAERMKFSTMVVFMILWGTLVYTAPCATGSGAAVSWPIAASTQGLLPAGPWTLPAGRSCTSVRACRP